MLEHKQSNRRSFHAGPGLAQAPTWRLVALHRALVMAGSTMLTNLQACQAQQTIQGLTLKALPLRLALSCQAQAQVLTQGQLGG